MKHFACQIFVKVLYSIKLSDVRNSCSRLGAVLPSQAALWLQIIPSGEILPVPQFVFKFAQLIFALCK